MRRHAIVVLLALLGGYAPLAGQGSGVEEPGRSGWVVGVSVGVGVHELEREGTSLGPEAGVSLPNLKIGRMVGESTALVLLLPGTIYRHPGDGDSARRRDRGFEGIVPSVQHWLGDRVWVLGGVGVAMDAPAFYDIDGEEERRFHFGTAAVGGAGVELLRRGRITSDAQARLHVGTMQIADGIRQRGYALTLLVGLNLSR